MDFLFGGGGGRGKELGQNSGILTAQKNHWGEKNALIIDMGSRPFNVYRELGILKKENIKHVVFHFTHFHADHFDPKSIAKFTQYCQLNDIKYSFIHTFDDQHFVKLLKELSANECLGQSKNRIEREHIIVPATVAEMLHVKKIQFAPVAHHRGKKRKWLTDPMLQCQAMEITALDGKKTAFATDHADPDYLTQIVHDDSFEKIYTDCTDLPRDIACHHISFAEVSSIVPPERRADVTLMHSPIGVVKMARDGGFQTVADRLLYNQPQYSHLAAQFNHTQHFKKPAEKEQQ